jgi:hypothetical protein
LLLAAIRFGTVLDTACVKIYPLAVRFRRVRRLALPDAAAKARGKGEEMRKLSNR